MQLQVTYKYGSFVHLGKVKKIRNLGCSCPSSALFFLSRDFDRGLFSTLTLTRRCLYKLITILR